MIRNILFTGWKSVNKVVYKIVWDCLCFYFHTFEQFNIFLRLHV